jgi:hypothetical protein
MWNLSAKPFGIPFEDTGENEQSKQHFLDLLLTS